MSIDLIKYPVAGALAFGLALWASIHAILRKRDPRAALWWVWMVWWVPFLGAVLYYFVGINRIERRASRLRRRNPPPSPSSPALFLSRSGDPDRVSPRMRHLFTLSRIVERVVGLPLMRGNSVTPLFNGDQAYPEMIRAIDEARESVGLATYIFNRDYAGQMFVEALARAAARKVKVRVLIDDVGSRFSWTPVYSQLAAHRIPVSYFMPTLVPLRMPYMNMRSHRKILTVDGRVAFTGGMNIKEDHLPARQPQRPTRDVHFRIEGPVVAQIQEVFRDDWHFSTRQLLTGPEWFPELRETGKVMSRGIADGPDEDLGKCRWTILGALANAKSSVRILTPYFVPDPSLISAINLAAISGVRVDIVLPQVSDLPLVTKASIGLLPQLLEYGCRVWITPPPFHHGKLMLVDGGWTLLGSSNWDPRSLRLNFEFNVECYDEQLTASLESYVDGLIAGARQLTRSEFERRPFRAKLRDGAARLFAPFL